MAYYQTAAVLATAPKDRTQLKPHLIANDVVFRMTSLLRDPPEAKDYGETVAKPPHAAFGSDNWPTAEKPSHTLDILRVEVSVDIPRLEDAEYKQSLIDDARFAALEFLKPLVRSGD